jgi:hypothetical protein
MLLRHAGYVLAGMAAVPGALASARRSLRPRFPRGDGREIAFAVTRIDKSGVASMARAAPAWGVTRADLMIALLMKAIAPIAGDARHGKRRRESMHGHNIAAISVRASTGVRTIPEFVPLLAPVADGISLRELAQDIHRVTAGPRRKLYLQTLPPWRGLRLPLAVAVASPTRRCRHKDLPHWRSRHSIGVIDPKPRLAPPPRSACRVDGSRPAHHNLPP